MSKKNAKQSSSTKGRESTKGHRGAKSSSDAKMFARYDRMAVKALRRLVPDHLVKFGIWELKKLVVALEEAPADLETFFADFAARFVELHPELGRKPAKPPIAKKRTTRKQAS